MTTAERSGSSGHIPEATFAAEPRTDASAVQHERPGTGSLAPAAQRALAEAEARRRRAEDEAGKRPREIGGRDGPDPARYGDWEKGGIVSDF